MTEQLVTAARIPRGTCKLFGAIKALATIRKSVVLVHGPKGCVYHINYILGMRGDRPSEIYTTSLDERDIIFGAGEKLATAIEELDRSLRPDLLFVLSCCSSGIIGEDVGSAVRDAQAGSRVIGISAGGFEGDFHDGYRQTLCQLVDQLVPGPGIVAPRTVNLVGMLRAGPDLLELRHLLDGIGVSVNAVLTADATRRDLENLGRAALNIVVCEPSGRDAAELLLSRCGTPFIIQEIPIGREATSGFLAAVAERLEIAPAALPGDAGEIPDCRSLSTRRIAIVSGPTRAIALTRFLAGHGTAPRLIVVDFEGSSRDKLAQLLPPGSEVLIEPSHELIVEKLREHGIDLILGGMLELPIAKSLGIAHLDIMHGSQKTVGFTGAANLARLLCKEGRPGQGNK